MIKMMKPLQIGRERPIAPAPPKRADPYYLSADWKATRKRVFERDGYRCCVPGCMNAATVVDHGRARRWGGSDDDKDLRSLCDAHDRRFKETPTGERKNEEG